MTIAMSSSSARACVAIALAAALTGCAVSLGRSFDEAYARQIKAGETTKAEVLGKLGRPALRNTTADEETWTYAYYDGPGVLGRWTASSEELQDGLGKQSRLIVVFKGDLVKSSKFTQEIPQR